MKIKEILNNIPINIEGLIRYHGIELDKNAELENSEAIGEIRKIKDGNYKISIKKTDHYYRKRFTMAHELGHFLLHKDKIGDGVNDSPAYRQIGNFGTGSAITENEEKEANNFAASILMPEEAIRYYCEEESGALDELFLDKMSIIFQTSKKALEIRMSNLEISIKK